MNGKGLGNDIGVEDISGISIFLWNEEQRAAKSAMEKFTGSTREVIPALLSVCVLKLTLEYTRRSGYYNQVFFSQDFLPERLVTSPETPTLRCAESIPFAGTGR